MTWGSSYAVLDCPAAHANPTNNASAHHNYNRIYPSSNMFFIPIPVPIPSHTLHSCIIVDEINVL